MFYRGRGCLVLGGTGFVGTHVARRLLDAGARVRITVHRRPAALSHPNLETVPCDLMDPAALRLAMAGMDCAFHCAGWVGSAADAGARSSLNAIEANVTLAFRVLDAAWNLNLPRLLMFGSSTAYPASPRPVVEDDLWRDAPHPTYRGYGWSRRYMETLAAFVHASAATRLTIVRPTAIYGPGDNFDLRTCHVVPALIRKAVERWDPLEVWGDGGEVRDFLHVSDLARGCLLALEHLPTCDPVNIGQGEGTTMRDLVAMVLETAGHAPCVAFDPTKPTTIPVRRVDIAKARKDLGFAPEYDLASGIAETMAWYRESAGG